MGNPARPIDVRLWERVDKESDPNGCWIWLGSFNGRGYGQMMIGSRTDGSRRLAVTHRLAYQIVKGEIPTKLDIDHLCRNRKCCNPDHLEAVPHSVNVNRAVAGSDYLCIHGHEKKYYPQHKRFLCITCRRAAVKRHRDKSKVA